MKLVETKTQVDSTSKPRYRNLSLVELIKEIADKSDRLALEEFHTNRTLFRYGHRPPLLFTDYLNELRKSAAKSAWLGSNASEVADKAYDFTIDKFNNLPSENDSSLLTKSKNVRNMKRKGTDCRFYFRAFLERVAQSFETKAPASQIEEEARAAMIMQGLVRRHFYLSLLEARRKANPFWSRYYWKVRGGTICVSFPVSLEGRQRRGWLEKNIDDLDFRRPGERERIQAIIDRKLVREGFVPFKEDTHLSNEERLPPWSESGETFGISLAEVVAKEKAGNIHRQRRSIRRLGKERLKELVLRIFKDVSGGEYEDGKVARDFALSKATFSRFAGSRWLQTESAIPDLWLNTAQALSTHPTFKEVAISSSVWKQVQSTLERSDLHCEEETSHG